VKVRHPLPVYLGMEAVTSLLFAVIFAASSVYQVSVVGLSPFQLVLVGTTLELSVLLFEVPTGVVADVYSRKLSIIVGYLLVGAGFLLEGSIPVFWAILLAQLVWGLGYTFTSGARQAWITDEIGETAAGQAFLKSSQIGQVASLVGLALGMLIGSTRVNLPIQIGGLSLILLAVSLAVVMPETGFSPVPRDQRGTFRTMVSTLREGRGMLSRRPALRTILLIGFIYGLYSEGFDRLWVKHLLEDFSIPAFIQFEPIVWIGLIRGCGMLMAIAATGAMRRKSVSSSGRTLTRTLFLLTGLLFASLLIFARADWLLLAVTAYWLVYVSRVLINPLYTAWVNQRLDSRVRATVLSLSGQVDALGQIAGGPLVGAVGSLFSVRAALTLSSLLLSPALLIYTRSAKRRA